MRAQMNDQGEPELPEGFQGSSRLTEDGDYLLTPADPTAALCAELDATNSALDMLILAALEDTDG